MIRALGDKRPRIHPTAFVSEAAYVIGDVEIGENSSVWPGVVIRGDDTIKIGKNSNIQDNSVVHCRGPADIGDYVTLGHNVVVEVRRIGNFSLIGNNSTVLPDTEIGQYCIIAANSVVLENSKIPDYSFVVGVPGQVKGRVTQEQIDRIIMHVLNTYIERGKKYRALGLGEKLEEHPKTVRVRPMSTSTRR